MKKLSVVFLLLCSMAGGVSAQRIELKGVVRDAGNSEAMAFVNVVLQMPDSAFVTGTTTDDDGKFVIPDVKPGDYRLAMSYIGYVTQYIGLEGLKASVTLPDIEMEEETVALDAVTVTASAVTNRIDRKLIFPTEQQVQASTNGIDLLQQLMLPRVQVHPITNEATVPGGGEVQLRINGVKVIKEEVLTLLPADIIRVEFHDSPGLRYGNAEVVIDYIVRRHETGGNIGVNVRNTFNLKKLGDYRVNATVNHKKSQFLVEYYPGRRNYDQRWRENEETFVLADGSVLRRREEGEPVRIQHYYHGVYTTYSYMNDRRMFNASVQYHLYNNAPWDFRGTVYNVDSPEDRLQMADLNRDFGNFIIPDLYYQENLKNDQTLVFNLTGAYNRTDNNRTYQESRDGQLLTDILNHVTGNKYSWTGEGVYEKKLGNNRLSAGLRHYQAFSDNTYRDNRTYNTEMQQRETSLYGEWKGKINKLDYMLGAGVSRSSLRQGDEMEGYETWNFNPRLTLFYPLSDNTSVRLKSSISNHAPSLADLSAVEQAVDSIQIIRGNPSLKPYPGYLSELNGEWKKGLFQAGLRVSYEYCPSAIMDEKYWEENRIVRTWNNQKSWQNLATSVFLRVGPVKDILQFGINGGFNRYISHGNTYRHVYNNPYLDAQLSATYKNFSAYFMWTVSLNRFYGETMLGDENIHSFTLRYKYNRMNFELGMFCPFTDGLYTASENRSAIASYRKTEYNNDFSRLAFFRFAYNFSFGRTFNAGQKRLDNADKDAGIMKAGK
jgi:hypothetical protein